MISKDFYTKCLKKIDELDNECFIDIDTGEVVWVSKEKKINDRNLFNIIMTN
mgnify:CR=1 FL=1|tara:strand:+ start:2045 stop:2200 length:156 start_codon:yes stop_codon:yes gene_type:complete